MSRQHKHFALDRVGILVSVACFIHCLLPPILLMAFPFITALQAFDLWLHVGLAAVMIPIATKAIAQGYRHHSNIVVPGLALLGLALFLTSIVILFLHHEDHSHYLKANIYSFELILSIVGSLALTLAHILNMYFCRKKDMAH